SAFLPAPAAGRCGFSLPRMHRSCAGTRALRGLQTPAASPIFSGTIPSANRRCPMSIRPVIDARPAQPTMEGAGVRLHRAFGFRDPKELDPFLLFDDFRNERPEDYLRGFP